MSPDDVNPSNADPQDKALELAQDLIRKLDEESGKKLEQVSAEEKLHDQGAARNDVLWPFGSVAV